MIDVHLHMEALKALKSFLRLSNPHGLPTDLIRLILFGVYCSTLYRLPSYPPELRTVAVLSREPAQRDPGQAKASKLATKRCQLARERAPLVQADALGQREAPICWECVGPRAGAMSLGVKQRPSFPYYVHHTPR